MRRKSAAITILAVLIGISCAISVNNISTGSSVDGDGSPPQPLSTTTVFTENFTAASFTSNWIIYNIDGGGTWNNGAGSHTADGSGCAQVQDGVSGADHLLRDQAISNPLPGTYNLSFWVYSTGAGESIGVGVDSDNNTTNGGTTTLTTYTTLAATTWEHYSYQFNASALGLPDPFYLYFTYNGTLYMAIDDVTLTFETDDSTPPSSSVDAMTYWYTAITTPVSITATASDDASGVKQVALYYRYSTDNSSWGAWNLFANDTSSPWEWTFTFPDGEGYYEFYTIAEDNAGNVEGAPPSADENAGYDATAPTSSVDAMPYWHTSASTVINASASDSLSGVKKVTLYYRVSIDNSTWGSWIQFSPPDYAAPWQFSFTFTGSGYYQFYTVAEDNASNVESPPVSADEEAGADLQAPSTGISASPSYGNAISPSSIITISASDAMSGVAGTYYRIWNGSWHPSPGTGVGKDNNFSSYSGSFSLTMPGINYVEYYSDDVAGNQEATHNYTYNVDVSPPSLSNIVAVPSSQTAGGYVNVSCTAEDTGAGIAGVYLEVIYPDSSFANFTMNYIHCTTYYRSEVYNIVGTYNYTIYAKDNFGNAVKSAVYHFTITSANSPPNTPSQPSGPTSGVTGVSYTYSSATTDPNGDNVYYFFDWGDSSNSGWVGPYSSGFTGSASHAWSSAGTYYVKVKAKDTNNAESGWSNYLTVSISTANNPPITSYTLNPSTPTGENGWYLGPVNVTLSATDPDGDAVAYTNYRVDGGSWNSYTGPFLITGDGNHLLEFYSADDKGNIETTKSATVKIDTSGPSITLQRPLPGYLYLFNRQVWPMATGTAVIIGRIVVRATAFDSHSNIENVSFYVNGIVQNIDTAYPYEWLWRGATGYRYLYASAYNRAGLMEETDPILVYIFSL
ncbi:MAG: hypothetical protein FE046_00255 [Thermoplasmata archaeon]|nr:MAG: hypothetical protein FE046_00255 [Thermoplasmata archaeon]RLF34230.1 MAG: hypothetical protein DRN07_00445 [Thermoplasmata archaeon]